jgi:group I intron endonuclease
MWKIYCYTNVINGKKYVGVTKKTLKSRAGKNGREYIRHNQQFGQAIIKYGWNNFKSEILDTCEMEQEASKLERHYIEKLNTTDPSYGYNRNKGGSIPTDKEIAQYDLSGNYLNSYRTVAEASKAIKVDVTLICENCKGNIKTAGNYIWRYSWDLSNSFGEEELTPFSGERKVNQLDLKGNLITTYNSAKEAEENTKAIRSKICMCCKGQRKTAGGYKWEYTDGFNLKDIYSPAPSKVRKVIQYKLDGTFVAEYASQNEAHRQTGFSADMIGRCCRGLRKSSVGYVWKYKD